MAEDVAGTMCSSTQLRKTYHSYTDQQQADIGRYPVQHGKHYFTKQLKHPVWSVQLENLRPLSTGDGMNRKCHAIAVPEVSALPPKTGRPLLMGDFDSRVQEYILA